MKKGYRIKSNILSGDRFIIVNNCELNNIVYNCGTYKLYKQAIDIDDVGVWKIKKLN